MSIYINSNDVYSGTSYDGRFYFSRTFSGQFVLQDYNLNNLISNWCNSTNNILYCYPSFNNSLPAVRVSFANINSSNPEDIKNWFETAFQQLINAWAGLTCAVTYNYNTDIYTITFNHSVFFGILLPSEIELPEDPDEIGSTIAELFNWSPNGSGLLPNSGNTALDPHSVFHISGINFGTPHYLEVKCPQITSKFYTSKTSNPSFILSTRDDKILGQKIYIPAPVNYLDLKVYKSGYYNSTYNLNNEYDIIFKPS